MASLGWGALAGMLSAVRWAPLTSWIFVVPGPKPVSVAAIRRLLKARRPGIWAALPNGPDTKIDEPELAYCDFRIAPLLEQFDHLAELRECSSTEIVSMESDLPQA